MTAAEVVERLKERGYGVRQTGDHKWRSRCPGHEGDNPSALEITERADGKVGVTCYAHQCDAAEILAPLGLKVGDLYPDGRGYTPPPLVAELGRLRLTVVGCRRTSLGAALALVAEQCLEDVAIRLLQEQVNGWSDTSLAKFAARVLAKYGDKPPPATEGEIVGALGGLHDRAKARLDAQQNGAGARRKTAAATKKEPEPGEASEAVAAAQAMLKAADLMAQVDEDLAALGIVGEQEVRLQIYLMATGRKLPHPPRGRIVADSSAGKSHLVDAVMGCMPPEDVVRATGLSPQSLVYMPRDGLRHKILYIAEEVALRERAEGEPVALSYARELLSHGKISRLVPVKGPDGQMETIRVEVEGPVAFFLTGTALATDDELATRLWTMGLDESPAQTAAIHTRQRQEHGPDGLRLQAEADRLRAKHQALQRRLQVFPVVIPYADRLTFPTRRLRARRDLPQLLSLIEASALLHQHQRPRTTLEGQQVIVAAPQDYEIAFYLFRTTAAHAALDEVPKKARELHQALTAAVEDEVLKVPEAGWTVRQIADAVRQDAQAVRRALKALMDVGLVELPGGKGQGKTYRYVLVADRNVVTGLDELRPPDRLDDQTWQAPCQTSADDEETAPEEAPAEPDEEATATGDSADCEAYDLGMESPPEANTEDEDDPFAAGLPHQEAT